MVRWYGLGVGGEELRSARRQFRAKTYTLYAQHTRPSAVEQRLNDGLPASRLPLTAYHLPLTAYRLPLSAYRLPLTAFRFPLPAYHLPLSAYRLPLTVVQTTSARRPVAPPTRSSRLLWAATSFPLRQFSLSISRKIITSGR